MCAIFFVYRQVPCSAVVSSLVEYVTSVIRQWPFSRITSCTHPPSCAVDQYLGTRVNFVITSFFRWYLSKMFHSVSSSYRMFLVIYGLLRIILWPTWREIHAKMSEHWVHLRASDWSCDLLLKSRYSERTHCFY